MVIFLENCEECEIPCNGLEEARYCKQYSFRQMLEESNEKASATA